jgi:hypothetical protein
MFIVVESLSQCCRRFLPQVIAFGGDVLKFAGDAFFAEWRIVEETSEDEESMLLSMSSHSKNSSSCHRRAKKHHPLEDLNASLASIAAFDNDNRRDMPPESHCVMLAAKCAAVRIAHQFHKGTLSRSFLTVDFSHLAQSIVKKYSDYVVTTSSSSSSNVSTSSIGTTNEMLNGRCRRPITSSCQ